MKHYKKFYEIGNNRYYTIVADDEMYIASESFLQLGKKKLFRKQKYLNTGFKLLKFSSPIAQLFNALDNLEPSKKQRYDSDDLIIYNHIDNKKLKQDIKNAYLQVYNDEVANINQQMTEFISQGKGELAEQCKQYLEHLKNLDLMDGIDLKIPEHTGCMIIKTMLREGLEHLFTERVNAFTNNVYLYDQDEFGTLTIYKIITIKNVVKTIDTFIYDKKLIECLLKTLYEEGR
jgi:hypothetical protein